MGNNVETKNKVAPEERPRRRTSHGAAVAIWIVTAIIVVLIGLRAWQSAHTATAAPVAPKASPAPARVLIGHKDYVSSVAFSPDGRLLASGSADTTVRLWDTATGDLVHTHFGPADTYYVAFSPDGKTLATAGGGPFQPQQVVMLWDPSSGKTLRSIDLNGKYITSLAYSPNGKMLAADVLMDKQYPVIVIWDAATGSELRRLDGYSGPAFSPDSKLMAGVAADGGIGVLDAGSGATVRRLPPLLGYLSEFVFIAGGKRLALGSDSGEVVIVDAASGNVVHSLDDPRFVGGLAVSHDGRTLATGANGDVVKLWDVASGKLLGTLAGQARNVSSIAFSADDMQLASGDANGKVQLWPLLHGR